MHTRGLGFRVSLKSQMLIPSSLIDSKSILTTYDSAGYIAITGK